MKRCPDCSTKLVEVNDAIDHEGKLIHKEYPKVDLEPYKGRTYHEYRFFCRKCKKEWLYLTRPDCRWFEKIPLDSQFRYSEQKKILVLRPSSLRMLKKIFKTS
jgi:hypothetical protein